MSYEGVGAISVGAIALGLSLWLGLLYWDRRSPLSLRGLLVIVVTVAFLARLLSALFTPTFNAPDEQSHFNYIKYLYQQHALPLQTSKPGFPSNDWENSQPPLYYLAVLPVYGLCQQLCGDEVVTVRILRLLSVVIWSFNVLLMLGIVRRLGQRDLFIEIFVVAMFCLIPTSVFLSSVINNDTLSVTLSGVILYLILGERSTTRSLLVGVTLGLAMLTKMTTAILFIAIGGMLAYDWRAGTTTFWEMTKRAALMLAVGLIIWSPWAVRNIIEYGDILAEEVSLSRATWPSFFHGLRFSALTTAQTFWAASGILANVGFLPSIGAHVSYAAAAGMVYGLATRRRWLVGYLKSMNGAFIFGTSMALLVDVALVLRYGILYPYVHGRFLYPLLIPICLMTAVGIKMLIPSGWLDRAHVHAVGFFATYVAANVAFSLGTFMRT